MRMWHARRPGFWAYTRRLLGDEPVSAFDGVIGDGNENIITDDGGEVIVDQPAVETELVNAGGDTLINAGGDTIVKG